MIRNNWRRRLPVASLDYCIVECAAYNTGTLVANCLDEKLYLWKKVWPSAHSARWPDVNGLSGYCQNWRSLLSTIHYPPPAPRHTCTPPWWQSWPRYRARGRPAPAAGGGAAATLCLSSVSSVQWRLNTKYKLIIANGCQHFELLCPESRPELIIDFTFSPFFV